MVGWVSFRLSLEQQLANLQMANLPGPTELETHLDVRPLNFSWSHTMSKLFWYTLCLFWYILCYFGNSIFRVCLF